MMWLLFPAAMLRSLAIESSHPIGIHGGGSVFTTRITRGKVGSMTPPTRVHTGATQGYVEPPSMVVVFGTMTQAGTGFVTCVVLSGTGQRGPGAAAAAETRNETAARATKCTHRINLVRMAHLLFVLIVAPLSAPRIRATTDLRKVSDRNTAAVESDRSRPASLNPPFHEHLESGIRGFAASQPARLLAEVR